MIFNEYTGTSDQPILPDFPGWNAVNPNVKAQAQNAYALAWTLWVQKHNIPQWIQDQWNAENIARGTQEEQTNFWKKVKAKANEIKTNVQQTVNEVKDKAQAVIDKGKENALLVLFTPYVPVAILFLKRRGIAPAKTIRGLLLQVNDEIGKNGFALSANRKADSFDYGIVPNSYGLAAAEADGMADVPFNPGVIINTVAFLKELFETIKKKKASGEPLTDDERVIADNAGKIEADYEKAKEEAAIIEDKSEAEAKEIEGGGFSKNILIVLIILAIIWFLLRK